MRRVPAVDSAGREEGVEGVDRLPSPQLGRDGHEPDERLLREVAEEPLGAQPNHRDRPPLQNPQHLRLPRYASQHLGLGNRVKKSRQYMDYDE